MHNGHKPLKFISSIDPDRPMTSPVSRISRTDSFIQKTNLNTILNAQSRLSNLELTLSSDQNDNTSILIDSVRLSQSNTKSSENEHVARGSK
eukprot:UN26110